MSPRTTSKVLFAALALSSAALLAQQAEIQKPEAVPTANYNIVVAVEGCGVHGGTCTNVPNGTGTGVDNSSNGGYGDNQAAPLTLFNYTANGASSATFNNSIVLPQSASGANAPVSGEYGSSSEATVQLSGTGQYLTIMGYGINANTFNAGGAAVYGNAALAQSTSIQGGTYTAVPRVVALIDPNGNVNSSTQLYSFADQNNPRSAYTANSTTVYVSGQGNSPDLTGGVFYVPVGTTTTVSNSNNGITGADTNSMTSNQDTRTVQIYNNTLYISVDSKEGSGNNRAFIGTLGTPPATSLFSGGAGPTQLSGFGTSNAGKYTITSGSNSNGNNLNSGKQINLSPVNYFFANPATLYVADGGQPKNNSASSTLGDGGLQKWTNSKSDGTGTWTLVYTLYNGLNIVANTNTTGTSGVYGLTGAVSGSNVYLYATNYTLNDLDPTYLYGIVDNLTYSTASQAASEVFTKLDSAPADSNFKGVSLAPAFPAGSVELTSSPSGLAITVTGSNCEAGTYTTPVVLLTTPNSNCTLQAVTPESANGSTYAFSQWSTGSTNSSINITSPSTNSSYNATFTAVPSISFSSVSHNFGSVAVNSSTSGSSNYGVQVSNNSNLPFTFTGVSFSGSSAFSLYSNGCGTSIAAGKKCELVFQFKPTASGLVSAQWSFSGASSGTVFSPSNGGTLLGTGASGQVTITTNGHNFGAETVGTTSSVFGAVLTNNTTSSITVSVGSTAAPFTQYLNNCPSALAAGKSCNLQWTFTPTAKGYVSEYVPLSASQTIYFGTTPVTSMYLAGTGQ